MSKKTLRILIILVTILLIILSISLIIKTFVIPNVKHEVAKVLIDKYIDSNSQASDLINQMSDEDIAIVEEIIDNSVDYSDIPTLSQYAIDNDIDNLIEYADENISDEDKQKLYILYEKYKNSIPQ